MDEDRDEPGRAIPQSIGQFTDLARLREQLRRVRECNERLRELERETDRLPDLSDYIT
jgi:uncharacterized protein Yka (UPF0111/DUF47 family)